MSNNFETSMLYKCKALHMCEAQRAHVCSSMMQFIQYIFLLFCVKQKNQLLQISKVGPWSARVDTWFFCQIFLEPFFPILSLVICPFLLLV
jgi:p-aminobenzoyl-glutamate transporter AbgT